MGMSTFPLSPPFEFSRPEEWVRWKKRLQRYREATGLDKKDGPIQISTLVYSMGDREEDILSSFSLSEDDAKDYQKVLDRFKNHFVKKRNAIYERATFNQRQQTEGEHVENFITALYRLPEHCQFGALRDELIRDRIVVVILDQRLSEKLQLDQDLTLEKAVTLARQSETVKQQQKSLRANFQEEPA